MTNDEKPPARSGLTIGVELRQAREALGLSLRDVSERTKIRQPALRAIESDDLRQLPGGAIGRGFVKLYAREVGLDPHAMAERFDEQRESTFVGSFGDQPGTAAGARSDRAWFTPARAAMVLGTVAVLAIGYYAMRPGPEVPAAAGEASTAAESAAPAQAPSTPGPVEPPASTSTPVAEKAAQAPSSGVRVEIRATGECWIAATADGQQVVYRMLPVGERATFDATTEAVVRIGMPANVALTINGRPIRPFERPGSPITLRITPANYRDLVQP
jgi:cytoskeletal protein RodZ